MFNFGNPVGIAVSIAGQFTSNADRRQTVSCQFDVPPDMLRGALREILSRDGFQILEKSGSNETLTVTSDITLCVVPHGDQASELQFGNLIRATYAETGRAFSNAMLIANSVERQLPHLREMAVAESKLTGTSPDVTVSDVGSAIVHLRRLGYLVAVERSVSGTFAAGVAYELDFSKGFSDEKAFIGFAAKVNSLPSPADGQRSTVPKPETTSRMVTKDTPHRAIRRLILLCAAVIIGCLVYSWRY